MSVTAKIKCDRLNETLTAEGAVDQVTAYFSPDYEDDRNKEWSKYTPALSLTMTLKGEVAKRFNAGQKWTMTLDEEESSTSVPQSDPVPGSLDI